MRTALIIIAFLITMGRFPTRCSDLRPSSMDEKTVITMGKARQLSMRGLDRAPKRWLGQRMTFGP